MPTYEAQVDTFFYRYLLPDGPVKGADGTIPAGTQFDFSKIITQNNKEYGVIDGDLPLPGWNITGRYDYCVLYNDVQAAGTEPPPTVTRTHVIEVYSNGSIVIDGIPYN